MKQLSAVLLFTTALGVQAQTINQSGFTFNPSTLTVTAGTTVTFVLNSPHTATQVSQATWNANGNTPLSGGFNFNAGTHQFTPTIPGTYYYVCSPHASSGMKGQIIVEANTGVAESTVTPVFTLSPNPAHDELTVTANPATASYLTLVDASGREVLRHKLQGNDRVNVSRLTEGSYTAILLDAQGTMREKKRLNITH